MNTEKLSVEARAMRWMLSGDTGLSSEAICAHMQGITPKRASYPSDPADLGRCLRLLELIPEWKSRIAEMSAYGPGWAGQVECWEELAAAMADEVGIDWSKGKRAPVTYNSMQLAQAAGYRNDSSYRSTFDKQGHLSSATRIKLEVGDE